MQRAIKASRTGSNSGLSSLSASSITSRLHLLMSAIPFSDRSWIRPGVPTTICTGLYKRIISSRRLVPPVVTMTSTAMCFPISFTMDDVCRASSRVGTNIKTRFQIINDESEYLKTKITKSKKTKSYFSYKKLIPE